MKMPHAKHPFWTVCMALIASLLMGFIFWCGAVYKCPIELKDLVPIFSVVSAIGGVDYLRKTFASDSKEG